MSSAYGNGFARLEGSFEDDSRRLAGIASAPGVARSFHGTVLVGNEACSACPAAAREPTEDKDALSVAYQGVLTAAR